MNNNSDRVNRFLQHFKDNEKTSLKKGFQNLKGITELNGLLNSPFKAYPVIHIAGSKGKGSTAHLISHILVKAGYRVGLFTSPHIYDMRERIKLNNEIMSAQDYFEIMDELSRRIDPEALKMNPSFFDLFTMGAFLFFKKKNCDFAVVETGLGGLYDSTNIVKPALSILTSIELEHRALLGNSLEEITAHKCGIIKEQAPVLTGIENPLVLDLIQKTARESHSSLILLQNRISNIQCRYDLRGLEISFLFDGESWELSSPLTGSHQAGNILLSCLAVKTLLPSLDFNFLKEGVKSTRLEGRFEIMAENPPVIFDVAHTSHSVAHTMQVFEKEGLQSGCLIFSCCADKELEIIAKNLGSSLKDIFITSFEHKRCADPQLIYDAFKSRETERENTGLEISLNPQKLFDHVWKDREKYDYILVMGSFFLLSQITIPNQSQKE